MKLVYSDPKIGKSNQIEISNELTYQLIHKKIGEIIDGSAFGLTNYKLKITGGTDDSGFPMNKSIDSDMKVKILKRNPGKYRRQSVRGKIISNKIEQINSIIVEYGSKPINELFKIEEVKETKSKKEDQKQEVKSEEAKEIKEVKSEEVNSTENEKEVKSEEHKEASNTQPEEAKEIKEVKSEEVNKPEEKQENKE